MPLKISIVVYTAFLSFSFDESLNNSCLLRRENGEVGFLNGFNIILGGQQGTPERFCFAAKQQTGTSNCILIQQNLAHYDSN